MVQKGTILRVRPETDFQEKSLIPSGQANCSFNSA
jgi:hypothetical protein